MTDANGYPILLHLVGRRCVVIGGGKVAARKVPHLLEAGAEVVVISPACEGALIALAEAGRIHIEQTEYRRGLLAERRPLLVIAATNSAAVNQQVVDECHRLSILVNSVDDVTQGDFSNMAVIRRGPVSIAITTDSASPALSAHLKARLESVIGEEYAHLARWLAELRPLVNQKLPTQPLREAFWRSVIDSSILEHLRRGDLAQARAELDRLWDEVS